jgi:predicted amidohydrolase
MTTGPAHWHLTARARALDNQVYFAFCSPARDEEASYVAYGHSLVTDPWGEILGELGADEGLVIETLDMGALRRIREELPLLKSRRPTLYRL